MAELEGSASSKLVPMEAYDIGDTDARPNPRASDLGYVEGASELSQTREGESLYALCDSPNIPLSGGRWIAAEGDAFIDDVSEWY